MTIINYASDGLYPELIALFRVVAHLGTVDRKAIIDLCSPGTLGDATRLRSALARWTDLGLFLADAETIRISERFAKKRGESLEKLTARIPSACRSLMLEAPNCLPLWGDPTGIAADFVRGAAWLLAQDIYALPTSWSDVEPIQSAQIAADKKIIENDVRWNGLRFWMRYLGFATGDSGAFQVDPTLAIREELPTIFGSRTDLPAQEFTTALASRLPVFDFGQYRQTVEEVLNPAAWQPPENGHLSMSLSLALRRLALENVIRLEGKADAGTSFRLTGRKSRIWLGFESVRWMGERA
jgi:hypothetical protein